MNIKAYNPAMNNKVLLGLWFVLFAAMVLLTNWLFRMPVSQTEVLGTRMAATDKQITRLKAIHAEFMLNYDKEDNLFTTHENNIEIEANTIFGNIRNDIAYFKSNSTFKSKDALASVDDFSRQLTSFENTLNDLFMASRERGNKNSGLVSRWLELSKSMLTVTNLPDADVLKLLNQLKLFESEYLLFRELRILENISVTGEEIRNQLTLEEGGINPEDIDSYLALTGNLMALEKRIGHGGTTGIIPDLEASLQYLPEAFNNLVKLADANNARIILFWNSARYLAILLLTALCIYIFIRLFSSSIFTPLNQLAGFTHKMADGELPEEPVAAGNIQDIQIIKDALEKHVASLKNKLAFVQTINQNELNAGMTLSGENDLLGNELLLLQQKIYETAEKQVKNDEENLKRRYLNEGLAKFGDILRSGGNDFNTLGDAFIREIVKYLNAIQGGFFILDDSEKSSPMLNLLSGFAYNRKKYLQKSVAFGEGLVGTCAREKQTINLTEIPSGYISITSGLGDTLPDNLLLVPVIHDNDLVGVLEIASLHKFKDYEIEFAEEVGRSLASTINYTRNNQRTADLLAKSQQQASEMVEQEEEMRQNMEELKATQEESARREEEFRGIAEAIDNALIVIEYDLDGTIQEVNEKLCTFLGRNRNEIIGKQHQEVFEGTLTADMLFWKEVRNNVLFTTTETLKIGKKTFRLLEHFTTVLSRDGNAVKFINFATDDRTGNS